MTLLIQAPCGGDEVSTELLLTGESDIEAVGKEGATALIWAAEKGYISIVHMLLVQNARLEARNHYGRTPLYAAALGAHDTVVRRLLAQGAGIETPDNDGLTLFNRAVTRGYGAVVEALLEATSVGDADSQRAMLEEKAIFVRSEVNAKGEFVRRDAI
jgi:ankyrin repeat protein